ncbi:MAG: tRNA pseudouridine(38-40) synthase TruA [Verrucomicrobia bacterium]|nr:tRNA pseudouridine(38-40) synthase TruA [Lachnospiraceae bacterium]MBR4250665.1 tRNA pseudouridine(38-40) synthase TruA [Verrucomicrobiota bacterium]
MEENRKKRVKLTLAYDGTAYCGWQWQPNGRTIEEVLNEVLKSLLKEDIQVIGGSRTDSGVHAYANVAVFDTCARIPAEKISFAMNQKLPPDIVVQKSEEVPLTWHPRKCNSIKTYEYRILNRTMPFPELRLTSYFLYYPLDVEKMRQAAECLVGEHDFVSFCSTKTSAEETIRTLYSVEIEKNNDLIVIRLKGSGFLTHMVRIIAGTLIKIGMGIFPPQKMKESLEARDRTTAGPRAPAEGLTLISIEEQTELLPVDTVTNEHWDYSVYQDRIVSEGKAFIEIRRSDDRDLCRNVIRLVKHAYQNKAREVFIMDAESRLSDQQVLGDYKLHARAEDSESYPVKGTWFFAEDLVRSKKEEEASWD